QRLAERCGRVVVPLRQNQETNDQRHDARAHQPLHDLHDRYPKPKSLWNAIGRLSRHGDPPLPVRSPSSYPFPPDRSRRLVGGRVFDERTMATWAELEAQDPELAAFGMQRLHRYGVGLAFLATVAPDGSPRVAPVCPI